MGWAPRGQHCYAQKKALRKSRYNITAALNSNILFAPFLFEGYSNTRVYETYVEKVLIPSLSPGMILVIDNASFHKSKKIIDLLDKIQCKVIFLPPYSPDLNPIEHHWAAAQNYTNFYDASVNTLNQLC